MKPRQKKKRTRKNIIEIDTQKQTHRTSKRNEKKNKRNAKRRKESNVEIK